MRVLISNFAFVFINTNRVITYTINSGRATFDRSVTFFISINNTNRSKEYTNTTMRIFVTMTRNIFNIIKIIMIKLSSFTNSNTSIRHKFELLVIVFNKQTISIEFIIIANTKFLFPFIKYFTTKYILSNRTKRFSRHISILTTITNILRE